MPSLELFAVQQSAIVVSFLFSHNTPTGPKLQQHGGDEKSLLLLAKKKRRIRIRARCTHAHTDTINHDEQQTEGFQSFVTGQSASPRTLDDISELVHVRDSINRRNTKSKPPFEPYPAKGPRPIGMFHSHLEFYIAKGLRRYGGLFCIQ